MKFGLAPVESAEGAILAHSMRVAGTVLKKGRVLSASDLARLDAANISHVTVATPEADDILEDEAAGRLLRAIAPDPGGANVTASAPFTGRANLYAAETGVLTVREDLVDALNGVDEAITLATLNNYALVTARQMLATVKIIPYGVGQAAVARVEALLDNEPLLRVHPVKVRNARLILTRTPGMKDSVLAKGKKAVLDRLTALGLSDVREAVVPHTIEDLSAALTSETADLTLILTGSATSDRADVGPAALEAAGGLVSRFGMPVDPGNLLFLGAREGASVIGLPGCARSPKLNGADWVIERLACGLDVSSRNIARMGVGGLLKEIPSRPEPRSGGATAPRRPVVGAILLAAGASSRMVGRDKLLEEVEGLPLLRRVAERLLASSLDKILCVTRPQDMARRSVLDGLDLEFVENARAAQGMGTSIAAGVRALDPAVDAVLIMLCDMPDTSSGDIDRLIAGFDPGEDRAIVRAVSPDGAPGNPVVIGRRFFEALAALNGDMGARAIVSEHPEFVVDVPLLGRAASTDLDTPEDWARWRASN